MVGVAERERYWLMLCFGERDIGSPIMDLVRPDCLLIMSSMFDSFSRGRFKPRSSGAPPVEAASPIPAKVEAYAAAGEKKRMRRGVINRIREGGGDCTVEGAGGEEIDC